MRRMRMAGVVFAAAALFAACDDDVEQPVPAEVTFVAVDQETGEELPGTELRAFPQGRPDDALEGVPPLMTSPATISLRIEEEQRMVVRYTREGYFPGMKVFSVEPGGQQTIRVELEPDMVAVLPDEDPMVITQDDTVDEVPGVTSSDVAIEAQADTDVSETETSVAVAEPADASAQRVQEEPLRHDLHTRGISSDPGGWQIYAASIAGFPLAYGELDSADQARVDNISRELSERASTAENAMVLIVGWADATPWKTCKTAECNQDRNRKVALERAQLFHSVLAEKQIAADVRLDGMVADQRGQNHRGVAVFLYEGVEMVIGKADIPPGDEPEIVAHEPYPEPDEGPLGIPLDELPEPRIDCCNNLSIKVSKLDERVTLLEDRVTALEDRESVRDTLVISHVDTVVEKSFFDKVSFGAGALGIQHGFDNFGGPNGDVAVPSVNVTIGDDDWPLELFVEGGYRPHSGDAPLCDRADIAGVIGTNVAIAGPLKLTTGGFTAREGCTEGGPKLNERWLERTSGFFAGPTLDFHALGADIVVNPNVTYGWNDQAGIAATDKGPGLMLRVQVQTP